MSWISNCCRLLPHDRPRAGRSRGSSALPAFPTRDYGRERDVLLGARNYAQQLGVSPEVAETVMRLLIRSSLTTQERASVAAQASGSGRRALVIGGAGKMGGWFAQFLSSQGFVVQIADPREAAVVSGASPTGARRRSTRI